MNKVPHCKLQTQLEIGLFCKSKCIQKLNDYNIDSKMW